MAKATRRRAMPSTPHARTQPEPSPAAAAEPSPVSPSSNPSPDARRPARPARPRPAAPAQRDEPTHLVNGTNCTGGHPRGAELDAGRLGTVPTKKQSRIGFGLVAWCLGGLGLMAATGVTAGAWASLGLQIAVVWLAFAAVLVRRAGHRGRCWRTRTWRHAWGGLAPGSGRNPTREANT